VRLRGAFLVETLISVFLIGLLVISIFECVTSAIRYDKVDYQKTMAHQLCQQTIEGYTQLASAISNWTAGKIASSNPQYIAVGENHGQLNYWVYEADVYPEPNNKMAMVVVTVYEADLTSGNPPNKPYGPPYFKIDQMTTVVTHP
jgi:type II secretory pathway pseudopilin PulG